MKNLLLMVCFTFSSLASATCVRDFVHCHSPAAFESSYKLERLRCVDPQGNKDEKITFYVYNRLVSNCGPIPNENCMKPIFEMELNTYRHTFFQADLKMEGPYVLLKIDDRRFMHEGDVNLSTPNADYMLLSNYLCSYNG